MVTTTVLPGIPESHPNVDPRLLQFFSDIVYSTFYSDSSPYRVQNYKISDVIDPAQSIRKDKYGATDHFMGRYTDRSVSPEEIEQCLRDNIKYFLEDPIYAEAIKSASVQLLSVDETAKGNILTWKIKLADGHGLITGTLTGSVIYSIEFS